MVRILLMLLVSSSSSWWWLSSEGFFGHRMSSRRMMVTAFSTSRLQQQQQQLVHRQHSMRRRRATTTVPLQWLSSLQRQNSLGSGGTVTLPLFFTSTTTSDSVVYMIIRRRRYDNNYHRRRRFSGITSLNIDVTDDTEENYNGIITECHSPPPPTTAAIAKDDESLSVRTGTRVSNDTNEDVIWPSPPSLASNTTNDSANNYSVGTTTRSTTTKRTTRYTIHDDDTPSKSLPTLIQKYITTLPQYLHHRPIASHTQCAFDELQQQLSQQHGLLLMNSTRTGNNSNNENNHIRRPTKPIVIDNGCGTGRSTLRLGQLYPDAIVLGLDRSYQRLAKNKQFVQRKKRKAYWNSTTTGSSATNTGSTSPLPPPRNETLAFNEHGYRQNVESIPQQQEESKYMVAAAPYDDSTIGDDDGDAGNNIDDDSDDDDNDETGMVVEQVSQNVWLIRCEMIDFWRCMIQHSWHDNVQAQYLLYPNPYPKHSRLQSRVYAHPSFPLCLQLLVQNNDTTYDSYSMNQFLDRKMVIRSNWKQYLEEFAISAQLILDSQQSLLPLPNDDDNDNQHRRRLVVVGTVQEMIYPTNAIEIGQVAMTNFEQKYWMVGEPTYELILSTNC